MLGQAVLRHRHAQDHGLAVHQDMAAEDVPDGNVPFFPQLVQDAVVGQVPCNAELLLDNARQDISVVDVDQVSGIGHEPEVGSTSQVFLSSSNSDHLMYNTEPLSNHGQVPFTANVSETENVGKIANNSQDLFLNADAAVFTPEVLSVVKLVVEPVDIDNDLVHVQEVMAGGVGRQDGSVEILWDKTPVTGKKADKDLIKVMGKENNLPFHEEVEIPDMFGIAPKQIHKVGRLLDMEVMLPNGKFLDKVLPSPSTSCKSTTFIHLIICCPAQHLCFPRHEGRWDHVWELHS